MDLTKEDSGVKSVDIPFPIIDDKEGKMENYVLYYVKDTPVLLKDNFPPGYTYFKLMDPEDVGMRDIYAYIRVKGDKDSLNTFPDTAEYQYIKPNMYGTDFGNMGDWAPFTSMTGGRRSGRRAASRSRSRKHKKQTRRRRH